MTKSIPTIEMNKALLFICDYTDCGRDRYYLYENDTIEEVTASELVKVADEIICHDYWLIAPQIFKKTNSLPSCVTDIDDLRISISGRKEIREAREKVDISKSLLEYVDGELISNYRAILNRKKSVDIAVMNAIGAALLKLAKRIKDDAINANEWERYVSVERPVANYLIRSAAAGIAIDEEKLRSYKERIDFDYYFALKNFSAKYNMPLALPSDEEIINYLGPRGFDFTGVDVDYVLNFVPMQDNFSEDLLRLRKTASSRKVLASIPLSQKRIFPIVDWFGSTTSRIYYKDPALQNLAKKHRDILIPDHGKKFSYVDYDQYEAGIMAALSGDQNLMELYTTGDLYIMAAEKIFNDKSKRKEAKRLFLSYAYGMKRQSLHDASAAYGAKRAATKEFFDQFKEFERWKESVIAEFERTNKVGTILGNYLVREKTEKLSAKEKRSAVSQVVQGTASLIFKKALLELQNERQIQLKLPMHDAVLFQHSVGFDTESVVNVLARAMTQHFGNAFKCKASLANFLPESRDTVA